MNFKGYVAQDNLNVFINMDEFGEDKSIDGITIEVVLDYDLIDGPQQSYSEGVFLSNMTIFVRLNDLGYTPEEGQLMQFGDVGGREYPYTVVHVRSDMGILEIRLEGNRS